MIDISQSFNFQFFFKVDCKLNGLNVAFYILKFYNCYKVSGIK